jgi:hypothetical protein
LVVGGVGVAAAAAIAFAGVSMLGKPHVGTTPAQPPSAAADSSTRDSSIAATPQGAPDPATTPSATVPPAAAPKTQAPAPRSNAVVPVADQLSEMEGAVLHDSTQKTANDLLSRLSGLHLATPDENAHADYIRYRAYLNLNDKASACANLRDGVNLVTDSGVRAKWARRLAVCQ